MLPTGKEADKKNKGHRQLGFMPGVHTLDKDEAYTWGNKSVFIMGLKEDDCTVEGDLWKTTGEQRQCGAV